MVDLGRFRTSLRARLGAARYDAWFEALTCRASFEKRGINDQMLILRVERVFYRDWIITHFGSVIHAVARDHGFKRVYILDEAEDIPPVLPPLEERELDQMLAVFKAEMQSREKAHLQATAKRLAQQTEEPLPPIYAF